jgi:hypothetical protein
MNKLLKKGIAILSLAVTSISLSGCSNFSFAMLKSNETIEMGEFVIGNNEYGDAYITQKPMIDTDKVTSVSIPDGVKMIRYEAFARCKNLKSVTIPDSVTEIESGAFAGCESLEEIKLPKNLKRIEDHAFLGCTSLKSIIISNGI